MVHKKKRGGKITFMVSILKGAQSPKVTGFSKIFAKANTWNKFKMEDNLGAKHNWISLVTRSLDEMKSG